MALTADLQLGLACPKKLDSSWANHFYEDLMIIELNDNETRLLYNILLEQAAEQLKKKLKWTPNPYS